MIWLLVSAGYIVIAAVIFGVAHVVLTELDTDYDPTWSSDVCTVAALCLTWGITLPLAIIAGIVCCPFVAAYAVARKILSSRNNK